ncbi:hypothetical protein COLO4_01708 [Corchorus olitorius]|uniref:Uncharacterized protein n=1 Tax=Corchorus olitorius TaxID=93759 RepID=A0A1R3L2A8_9ROSI|nr:hypothetical protein COLO4_01708 [Corchorus olitorius]
MPKQKVVKGRKLQEPWSLPNLGSHLLGFR